MTDIHPISFKIIPTLTELKAGYPGIKALFFDMDGTIFNTEPQHAEAFVQIGLEHKIRPPYSLEMVHELLVGKADHLVYEIIKSWEGFPKHWSARDFVETKNANLLKILETADSSTFFPSLLQKLLKDARDQKFFIALVTSSEKVVTKRLLEISGLKDFFDLELTRDDCPKHKPDPWPYFEAKRISGFETNEIIIFEDSSVGLAAATATGAHVIKVEWH
ncbi:MAG TPA: HAD family phosphatase [Bacteriovoracaceae bacterium]|nr:HAD family phosphatase [Bacteriovoracaceae bacterium]